MTTPPHDHGMYQPTHNPWIDAYLTHLSRIRRSPRTIETYRSALLRADDALPLGLPRASTDELADWLSHDGWTASTQGTYTAAIASFFRWATRHEHLDYDPTMTLDRPQIPERIPDPASDEQVAAILARTRGTVWLASLIAAYSGARACEIARLQRSHVTEQQLRLHGKGDKWRSVPTHPQVWAQLAPRPAGPILGGLGERQVSRRAWSSYHHYGVPVGIHKLRGWYATSLLRAGVDVATVRVLLGHRSLATTQRYLGVAVAQARAAVVALPTWDADGADRAA